MRELYRMIREQRIAAALAALRLGPLALAAALLGGAPCEAQQFAADLVTAHGDLTAPAGKLRVSGDKIRIETPELADGFFLLDSAKPAAFFVRPAAGIFMEARQSSLLIRMFVTVDPADPCRQWQAMARVAGLAERTDWRCEHAGEAMIGGRKTDAYRAASAAGAEFIGWIDPARRFPLRIRMEDGTVITAENIRDEPQSAAAFQLPSGLRRFDPTALIEQIKQSDVWVATPETTPAKAQP